MSETAESNVEVALAALTVHHGRLGILARRTAQPVGVAWMLPARLLTDSDLDFEATDLLKASISSTGLGRPIGTPSFLEQLRSYAYVANQLGTDLLTANHVRGKHQRLSPTVRVAYVALVAELGRGAGLKAGASTARVFDIDDLLGTGVVSPGDEMIITHAVERVRSKFEYTTVATSLVTDPFTIPELRRIYESVWGVSLHPANFRRKVLATPGFVTPFCASNNEELRDADKGPVLKGTDLFSRGTAALLHPAMLRISAK